MIDVVGMEVHESFRALTHAQIAAMTAYIKRTGLPVSDVEMVWVQSYEALPYVTHRYGFRRRGDAAMPSMTVAGALLKDGDP